MVVGLTGSIGSGKSTALSIFATLGWRTLDCDKIVAVLLEQSEVKKHITDHFGAEILDPTKKIDKKKLASIVFNNVNQLNWLEDYLHPIIRQKWQFEVAKDPKSKWIIEVPLLYEKKLEDHFQFTVCILLGQKKQYKRLEKRGLSVEEIKSRLKQQLSSSEKARQADFILFNDGTIASLEKQIQSLIKQI